MLIKNMPFKKIIYLLSECKKNLAQRKELNHDVLAQKANNKYLHGDIKKVSVEKQFH